MSDAPRARLARRLGGFPALAPLAKAARDAIAEHAQVLEVSEGDLLHPPVPGGCLGVLVGEVALLRNEDQCVIHALGPGAILASAALFESEVSLRARSKAEVVRLPAAGIAALANHDPQGLARLAREVAQAERSLQLTVNLARLFPSLDRRGLDAFGAGIEWVDLRSGQWLFRTGDPGDAAYVLISGRLRAVIEADAGEEDDASDAGIRKGRRERVLNEMGAGETVGEMSLLSEDVRSAGVYAVRDSQLARLSRAAFDRLTEDHPQALRRIAGFVVERLRRHTSGSAAHRPQQIAFAVVATSPALDVRGFTQRLAESLAAEGTTQRIDRDTVDAALGRPGTADARDDQADGIRLVQWLNDRDSASRYLLYQADNDWSPWTERVLRQADHVVVLADATARPEPGPIERRLAEVWREARAPRRSLVLMHPPGASPSGTAAWLELRDVDRHFHVRRRDVRDHARLARLLTGRGLGLVLGGGGARGFAHLGVLRACEEAGIEIDLVGGTSIGSIIAALPAIGHDSARALSLTLDSFRRLYDPTLPLVALLTGRRIGERLRTALGDPDIEDLLIPYFSVATNLSRAEEVVHRTGSLFRAIRSSISLPGILPPVIVDNDLYVDGGLLNNLPIDVMRELSDGGPVFAIDVSPARDLHGAELPAELSGWRVLWQRFGPRRATLDTPYISNVMMRSAVVASLASARARENAALADLYLKMPVDEWALLDFDRVEPIARRGYEASREPINAWKNAAKRSG